MASPTGRAEIDGEHALGWGKFLKVMALPTGRKQWVMSSLWGANLEVKALPLPGGGLLNQEIEPHIRVVLFMVMLISFDAISRTCSMVEE